VLVFLAGIDNRIIHDGSLFEGAAPVVMCSG
jgi:hypothetical protein